MSAVVAYGIAREVHRLTGYKMATIKKKGRAQKVVRVRHAIAKALRERTEWSLPMIARFLGRKDHTTILHACRAAEAREIEDQRFAKLLAALRVCDPCQLGELDRAYATRRRKVKGSGEAVVLFVPVKEEQRRNAIHNGMFPDDGMNEDGETIDMYRAKVGQIAANNTFLAALNAARAA